MLEQRAARAGVVAVVLQRIRNGFRHDRVRGEVHDGIDGVTLEELREARGVAGVADDEIAMEYRVAKTRRQIVENNDLLAGFAELSHDVRADVASAPGNQNCFLRHRLKRGDIISTHECSRTPSRGPESGRSLVLPSRLAGTGRVLPGAAAAALGREIGRAS